MAAAQIEIQSFKQVEMPRGCFPSIVIYPNPADFPKVAFVARLWIGGKPTNIYMKADDLEDIRRDIQDNTPLDKITRDPSDDQVIGKVWF